MRTSLNLRHLEAIVSIAQHKSFSAAAVELHVSQPALSRTIRLVEEALGTPIFDRRPRTVELTAAGEELVAIARRTLLEFNESMRALCDTIEGKKGKVRVAVIPSMGQFLRDAAQRFSAMHPHVQFIFGIESTETILNLLEAREVDFALTVQPPPNDDLLYQHLFDDEYVLVTHKSHPLAAEYGKAKAVPWARLEHCDFIAAKKESNTRSATDAAFTQVGMRIRPKHEVTSTDPAFIAELVASGFGVSVLPASSLMVSDTQRLTALRLKDPMLKRRIGIVTFAGRTLSGAANKFLHCLVQSAAGPDAILREVFQESR